MCDLETSRIGAPYIYDISNLRVNDIRLEHRPIYEKKNQILNTTYFGSSEIVLFSKTTRSHNLDDHNNINI